MYMVGMATAWSSTTLCPCWLSGRQQGVNELLHYESSSLSRAVHLSSGAQNRSSSSNLPLSSGSPTVAGRWRIAVPLLRYTNHSDQRRMKSVVCSSNICWQDACVSKEQRRKLLKQKGCIVWLTGLSGSGKSTVAFTVDQLLTSMGKVCHVLDGDNLRHGLCKNLGFSAADRQENMRRVGETAKLFVHAGLITCVSLISPYKRDRDAARELVRTGEFIEVYMDVPLEVCERRDCKGLYKLARAGVITGFTGIDDPYEAPVNPEITLKDNDEQGNAITADEMAWTIVNYLSENGYLSS